jgi:hypothetical protein
MERPCTAAALSIKREVGGAEGASSDSGKVIGVLMRAVQCKVCNLSYQRDKHTYHLLCSKSIVHPVDHVLLIKP